MGLCKILTKFLALCVKTQLERNIFKTPTILSAGKIEFKKQKIRCAFQKLTENIAYLKCIEMMAILDANS